MPAPFALALPSVISRAFVAPCVSLTVMPSIASPPTASLPVRSTFAPTFFAAIVSSAGATCTIDCASTLAF